MRANEKTNSADCHPAAALFQLLRAGALDRRDAEAHKGQDGPRRCWNMCCRWSGVLQVQHVYAGEPFGSSFVVFIAKTIMFLYMKPSPASKKEKARPEHLKPVVDGQSCPNMPCIYVYSSKADAHRKPNNLGTEGIRQSGAAKHDSRAPRHTSSKAIAGGRTSA